MKRADLQRAAEPASYPKGLATTAPMKHMGHGAHEVVRTDEYGGHAIEIHSTYIITVDGKPVTAHMHVDNDGNVICHAIPTYRSGSMIDVVHRLIDVFPDDFPAPRRAKATRSRSHQDGRGGKK